MPETTELPEPELYDLPAPTGTHIPPDGELLTRAHAEVEELRAKVDDLKLALAVHSGVREPGRLTTEESAAVTRGLQLLAE